MFSSLAASHRTRLSPTRRKRSRLCQNESVRPMAKNKKDRFEVTTFHRSTSQPLNRCVIYLDYNATTPLSAIAREAMRPFLEEYFGNPSSVHAAGREARAA